MVSRHKMFSRGWSERLPYSIIINLLMVYLCYMVCRVAFILENLDMFGQDLTVPLLWSIFKGALLFDGSAIFYTNSLYLLLVLLPVHCKETPVMYKITKWIFVVVNTIANVVNLTDCIYFAFSQKRTTVLIFDEFGNNTNIGSIIGIELVNHWYFVLLAVLMTVMYVKCYRNTVYDLSRISKKRYYVSHVIWLIVFGLITVCCMRGSTFKTSSRPLSMADAHQYVGHPSQAPIVVNTPFSLIRTASKEQVSIPVFFDDQKELATYYSALHQPIDSAIVDKRNVVLLIVESFAEEFIGARNRDLDGGTYRGYTEFVDSLLDHSTTFKQTYANGWISIDAMPSVLGSVPKMYTSFILTPYALDDMPGIAKELKNWGYSSAFFHGAEDSSMGFQAVARSAGFDNYYGRTEYDNDPRFDGEKDFDGTWAIWDEEFLQFMCAKLTEMPEPFVAGVFTASSHHPFALPDRYKDIYLEEGIYPIHKCIRYTDNALRLFFNSARQQPWFDNTLFVITADHASSRVTHEEYKNMLGDFRVPIIFYDPKGTLPTGTLDGIAQQIDIMPTVLGILGYDREFVAFGKDLFNTDSQDHWAFNWHNTPQYIKGDYLLQFDDYAPSAVYNISKDRLLSDNLLESGDYDHAYVDQMVSEIEALMQDADYRMKNDLLRIKDSDGQHIQK